MAVIRIRTRVGVVPNSLRGWVKQSAVDAGQRRGVTTVEAPRAKKLERKVRELKRANEILFGGLNSSCLVPGLMETIKPGKTNDGSTGEVPRGVA